MSQYLALLSNSFLFPPIRTITENIIVINIFCFCLFATRLKAGSKHIQMNGIQVSQFFNS